MAVYQTSEIKAREVPELSGLSPENYAFFELRSGHGPAYAFGALGEHADSMELHLAVIDGRKAFRNFGADLEWLKDYARRAGKSRIVGVKSSPDLQSADPSWRKFAERFGFTFRNVSQVAALEV